VLSTIPFSDYLTHPLFGATLVGGAGFALGRRRAAVPAFPIRMIIALVGSVSLAALQAIVTLLLAALTANLPGLWPLMSQVETNLSQFWTCAWDALRTWTTGTRT
jgi:hypothetical protein